MVDGKGKITGTKISLKFKEEDVIKQRFYNKMLQMENV